MSNISCNANTSLNSVTLSLSPGIGQAGIGTVNTADLAISRKTLVVSPEAGGTSWHTATFNASDIHTQAIKTVSTNVAVTSIGNSLTSHTQLTANVLGLGEVNAQVNGLCCSGAALVI